MQIKHPNVLHVVGSKNSGKTRLIKTLISGFRSCGLRVGTIKHSSHDHPLDKPGSDSQQFQSAGADPVIFSTREGAAVFYPRLSAPEQEKLFKQTFKNCDLLLVESFRQVEGPKIVISSDEHEISELKNILAVINKNGRHPRYPAFSPDDPGLLDFLKEKLALIKD